MEQDIPDYDMDSEDERWINSQAKKLELTPLKVCLYTSGMTWFLPKFFCMSFPLVIDIGQNIWCVYWFRCSLRPWTSADHFFTTVLMGKRSN